MPKPDLLHEGDREGEFGREGGGVHGYGLQWVGGGVLSAARKLIYINLLSRLN